MDKTEYKIRAEEIKSLIKAHRFADAVKIADTIDWKRVKSVGMLCAISDLYKVNRRLEESRDILLLAYDRSPTRREIVYSLCELAIAMGEFVQAVEYYKEFVRLAPRNTARYILQYKLYEAQEVSLEERIAVLEEYKKHDYNEKWAYELAYLYHRVGLTTECIEECDELFLYMREGRFVMKALELKSLHEPLSPEQKAAYLKYKAETGGSISAPEVSAPVMGRDVQVGTKTPTKELPQVPEDFEAGDLAKSPTAEIPQVGYANYGQEQAMADPGYTQEYQQSQYAPVEETGYVQETPEQNLYSQETQVWEAPAADEYAATPEAVEYKVPTVNVSDYNTVDLQKEIAENLKEVLIENPDAALFADAHGPQVVGEDDEAVNLDTGDMFDTTTSFDTTEKQTMSELFFEDRADEVESEPVAAEPEVSAEESVPAFEEQPEEAEIPAEEQNPFEDGLDNQEAIEDQSDIQDEEVASAPSEDLLSGETKVWGAEEIRLEETKREPMQQTAPEPVKKTPLAKELKDKEIAANIAASTFNEHALYRGAVFTDEPLQDEVPGAVIKPNVRYKINNNNNHFDKMLSQEYDGQISLAIDEQKQVEQQITGQISINDLLTDWEAYKKDQQEKQLQKVKKLVAQETGELFKDFDQNLIDPLMAEETEKEAIKEVLTPGSDPVDIKKTAKEMVGQAIKEDLKEIKPAEDLQNTQSMVQISGEDLKYAEAFKEEPEEEELPAEEEELSEEELAAGYQDDEDLEDEELTSDDTEQGIKELKYTVEDNPDAAKVDLGNTTVIEASEVEEAVEETEKAKEESEEVEESKEDVEDSKEEAEEKTSEDKEDESTASKEPEKAKEDVEESEDEEDSDDDQDAPTEKEEKDMETRVRVMTPEEKELFGPYIHHRKSRKQIIEAIDNLSMAAYTNNAIVTGEEGAGTVNLAKGLIKAIQSSDSNFSGKVAMISAITLNKRSVSTIFEKIVNGALIIRRAADLKEDTVATLLKQLQIENKGYIVIIEDTKDDIDRLLDKYPPLKKCFNVRVDIEALDDDALVAYAKQYALEKEYVIDNLGILALHQNISERQTLDHEVTVAEVKEMVDDAIYYASKRSVGHVVDVLLRKRYDESDMIILREKDFLH
ncbi:MAG: hypothetical protein E7302_11550 [Butyrivibrio sp.]|nr:hypothetical protein [Butyrivibrio sp.]